MSTVFGSKSFEEALKDQKIKDELTKITKDPENVALKNIIIKEKTIELIESKEKKVDEEKKLAEKCFNVLLDIGERLPEKSEPRKAFMKYIKNAKIEQLITETNWQKLLSITQGVLKNLDTAIAGVNVAKTPTKTAETPVSTPNQTSTATVKKVAPAMPKRPPPSLPSTPPPKAPTNVSANMPGVNAPSSIPKAPSVTQTPASSASSITQTPASSISAFKQAQAKFTQSTPKVEEPEKPKVTSQSPSKTLPKSTVTTPGIKDTVPPSISAEIVPEVRQMLRGKKEESTVGLVWKENPMELSKTNQMNLDKLIERIKKEDQSLAEKIQNVFDNKNEKDITKKLTDSIDLMNTHIKELRENLGSKPQELKLDPKQVAKKKGTAAKSVEIPKAIHMSIVTNLDDAKRSLEKLRDDIMQSPEMKQTAELKAKLEKRSQASQNKSSSQNQAQALTDIKQTLETQQQDKNATVSSGSTASTQPAAPLVTSSPSAPSTSTNRTPPPVPPRPKR